MCQIPEIDLAVEENNTAKKTMPYYFKNKSYNNKLAFISR